MNRETLEMSDEVLTQLFEKHGPLMSGEALWKSLGFNSSAAFRKAKDQNRLNVKVFSLPKRRGIYALTKDIACWLEQIEKGLEENF